MCTQDTGSGRRNVEVTKKTDICTTTTTIPTARKEEDGRNYRERVTDTTWSPFLKTARVVVVIVVIKTSKVLAAGWGRMGLMLS